MAGPAAGDPVTRLLAEHRSPKKVRAWFPESPVLWCAAVLGAARAVREAKGATAVEKAAGNKRANLQHARLGCEMFCFMRKSARVSVVLLSAASAVGIPNRLGRAETFRVDSRALASTVRGGFGEAIGNYWPIAGAIGAVFVISFFSGRE
jgi:hypothetical protein